MSKKPHHHARGDTAERARGCGVRTLSTTLQPVRGSAVHHYLTLSTGHPAKEKCAPLAKSISGPSSPPPNRGLFYARQSEKNHPVSPKKPRGASADGRFANRLHPGADFLQRIVGNRKIPGKSPDFGAAPDRRTRIEREFLAIFWPRLARKRSN